MQLIKEIDYVGLVLFMAGCVLFLLGINYGGRQYAWTSGQVITPIVVGLLCLIGLGFYEVYADLPQPIMPPKLFKKWREVTMTYVVCFVGGMLYCKPCLIPFVFLRFKWKLTTSRLHECNLAPPIPTPLCRS